MKGLDHRLESLEHKMDIVISNQNITLPSHEYTAEFYHAPKEIEVYHAPKVIQE